MTCSLCAEPAVCRIQLTAMSGRVMLTDPRCAKHRDDELRLAQTGLSMAAVTVMALEEETTR